MAALLLLQPATFAMAYRLRYSPLPTFATACSYLGYSLLLPQLLPAVLLDTKWHPCCCYSLLMYGLSP